MICRTCSEHLIGTEEITNGQRERFFGCINCKYEFKIYLRA